MPKKNAKDHDENVDYGPYNKDDSEEEETGQNITPKADAKTTTKTKNSTPKSSEKAAEIEKLQSLYAEADVALPPDKKKAFWYSLKPKETTTRAKYDHETTMKILIDDTEDVVDLMKVKDNYESVHYMGLLCEYWKSLLKMNDPENRAKKANDAFFKYFKKYQYLYGLPITTPSTAGSKTSSRTVSVIGDEVEEEMEEMEEMEEEEEETEETK